jgi:hypothetical protein
MNKFLLEQLLRNILANIALLKNRCNGILFLDD